MPAAHLARCLCALAFAALIGASAAAARDVPNEPFFPHSGSRDYDVANYDVQLAYQPASGKLRAAETLEATARQRLGQFSLDLDGLDVTAVTVDGAPARFSRGEDKLRIVPATPLAGGEAFTATVAYRGKPGPVTDPDGSTEGWYRTPDGAIAVGEPVGTAAWIPCDNTLTDKAEFSIAVTVPKALRAVANGRLVASVAEGARHTYAWRESQPMAPYLAVVDIGRGKLVRGQIGDLPSWTLVDPSLAAESKPALAALPGIVSFESKVFGPYPFDAVGSIVDAAPLEYALETQTRPIYAFAPDRTTVVHETAHQWFGDSVGLRRWPEIWLNEGFATWTQWYFAERHGGKTALETFRHLYAVPASEVTFWEPPTARPGQAKNLFAPSTYVRGGMALEALRLEVGTKPILRILHRWATAHRYGTAGIRQFIALAEEVSGKNLKPLFQRWLYSRGKPPLH